MEEYTQTTTLEWGESKMVQWNKIIHSEWPRKASRPNFDALPFIYLLYNVPHSAAFGEFVACQMLIAQCSFPVDARTRTDLQCTVCTNSIKYLFNVIMSYVIKLKKNTIWDAIVVV